MRISLLANILELPIAPRYFLLFTAMNVISWQCVVGQTLVLFSRAIDMPPSWVGVLIAAMPLSMFLVVFTVQMVEWQGPRRVLISTWVARNLLVLPVFAVPWFLEQGGVRGAWQAVMFATLAFSVIRALGISAWYPWLHEIIPRHQLGTYFSVETVVAQLITILITLVLASILALGESLHRFYLIYAVGIATGLASALVIRRIPGGRQVPVLPGEIRAPGSYRMVLADRAFVRYVTVALCGMSAVMWLNAATVMYLRDALSFPEPQIMMLIAMGALAVAATVHFWDRYADRFGSVPAMLVLLAGHALVAFSWWLLLPGASWTFSLSILAMVGGALFGSAYMMLVAKGMLGLVKESNRVRYTTVWIIGSAAASGIPPILAGIAIDYWQLAGFRLCFSMAGGMALLTALLLIRQPQPGEAPPVPYLHDLIRPSQPLRSLARIVWIALGYPGRHRDGTEAGK